MAHRALIQYVDENEKMITTFVEIQEDHNAKFIYELPKDGDSKFPEMKYDSWEIDLT